MPKSTTVTQTKTATKEANTRTSKPRAKKAEGASEKPKREPTAYQLFCKEQMKKWNEENPGRAKEAMSQIAALWKNAPENPNRGQEPRARKPKEPKEPKEPKPKAARAKKSKKAEKVSSEEEEDAGEASDD